MNAKKLIVILNILLLLGCVVNNGTAFLSVSHFLEGAEMDRAEFLTYFNLRQAGEVVFAVCQLIYMAGYIYLVISMHVKKIAVSFKTKSLCMLLGVGVMLAAMVPFAILNRDMTGDFLFSLWETIPKFLFLYLVSLFAMRGRSSAK